jgi:hypothetical protein
MAYNLLADLVVIVHFLFVLFSLLGALLVIRWRKIMWLHLPAAFWAAAVEFSGKICPLTPLENWLRIQGGGAAYSGDFIGQYLLWLLYPSGLTRGVQIILGAIVVGVNIGIYAYLFSTNLRKRNVGKTAMENNSFNTKARKKKLPK